MRLAVYGCGYAGLVSALGLCEINHQVLGVDISPDRVNQLSNGHLNSKDKQLSNLLNKHLGHSLSFCLDHQQLTDIDAVLIAVPTPLVDGQLTLQFLQTCLQTVLKNVSFSHMPFIVLRSTLPIGGLEKIEKFVSAENNWQANKHYQVYYIPEFMREGTGLDDWNEPPLLICGANKSHNNLKRNEIFGRSDFDWTTGGEAEAIKLFCNAFHATKVTFANEAMRVCEQFNISSENVMKAICSDDKLNISKLYLKPGFPWGGSCLGKDSQALSQINDDLPLLSSLSPSNQAHVNFYKKKILFSKPKKVGFIGLGFKPDVVDTRDSPLLALVEQFKLEKSVHQINIFKSNDDSFLLQRLNQNKKISLCAEVNDVFDSDFILIRQGLEKELKLSKRLSLQNNFLVI